MAFDIEWHQYKRKDGKLGHWYQIPGPHYTVLNVCDVCGKISTPKKIHNRNDVFGWNFEKNDWSTPAKNMLCTGCWNKAAVIIHKRHDLDKCRCLLNKLTRIIRHEQKNQDNG